MTDANSSALKVYRVVKSTKNFTQTGGVPVLPLKPVATCHGAIPFREKHHAVVFRTFYI